MKDDERAREELRAILQDLNDKFDAEVAAEDASERANSVGGVPWSEAPIPSRFHRCYPHTTGWVGFDQVQRCACGAVRNSRFRGWLERNSRRKAGVA